MKVFRTEKERDTRLAEAARWNREFGLNYRALDMATLKAEEPHLDHGSLIGGLHWTDPTTVVDPLGLSKAYVALFEKLGGKLAIGDAGTPQQNGAGWTVTLADGTTAEAKDVIVALGPWADVLSNKQMCIRDRPGTESRRHRVHRAGSGPARPAYQASASARDRPCLLYTSRCV